MSYIILRLGTIFGYSPGIRFHTAINKFCYQAALGIPLTIWKQNYNQYRPYLVLNDCVKSITFFLENDISKQTYNVITDNFKLSDIITQIKNMIEVDLDLINTPLLNQQSYKVNIKKILKLGFLPKDNLYKEIKSIIGMLKCIKGY